MALLIILLLNLLVLQGLLLQDLLQDLLAQEFLQDRLRNAPLPLLGCVLGLNAHSFLDILALLLLDLLADGLGGVVALVLPDRTALGWCVALGLPLGHAVGSALLHELDVAERHGDVNALVDLGNSALFLGGWMAHFVVDGLADINHLVLALVMVSSVTNFVSHFVNDLRALQLGSLLIQLGLFE